MNAIDIIGFDNLLEIEHPKEFTALTNADILTGKQHPAIDTMQIMSADDFEKMVAEWIVGYLIPSDETKYIDVKRAPGAGDMGRDVIGVLDDGNWVNFQCKHYDNKLSPSIIWLELGKLCYYTYNNFFTVPKEYYFVSPKGIGPDLLKLIDNPSTINALLIDQWQDKCQKKITKKEHEVKLEGAFLDYVKAFDFSILTYLDPLVLIEQHKKTSYHTARFGGGLIKRRNTPTVPTEHDIKEIRYIEALCEAYGDLKKCEIKGRESIEKHGLTDHFQRQRQFFYYADTLEQFSRDNLPPESKVFEELKDEIYSGIVETLEDSFPDGYGRLSAVLKHVDQLQISSNPLIHHWKLQDRKGICHHLVNDGIIKSWVV